MGKKAKALTLVPKPSMTLGQLVKELDQQGLSLDVSLVPKLRLIEPTASKTDLYLACPYPWGKTAASDFDPGFAADPPTMSGMRFGSAFHEVMAAMLARSPPTIPRGTIEAIAKKFNAHQATLRERIDTAFPVVDGWLHGDNQWGIKWLNPTGPAKPFAVEQSVAYNPLTNAARFCANPTEDDHQYADRQPSEIPGTADVLSCMMVKGEKTVLVLDHKSGWRLASDWQPHTPAESGQLRTLALGLCRLFGATKAIVAYFHAPPNTPPVVHTDILTTADLEEHRRALAGASHLVGSGMMRPGGHCADCPVFLQCPTQTTSLAELKRVGVMTAERVGSIHQALGEYSRLEDKLRGEMRGWVKANGAAIRPDGQYVDLVEKEATSLSQASIIRAMGELKGRAMIEKLKILGCVETTTREELRAVKR